MDKVLIQNIKNHQPKDDFVKGLWFLVIFSLSALLALEVYYYKSVQRQQVLEVTESLSRYRSKLEYLINHNLALTKGVAAYVAVNPEITQNEYEKFAGSIFSENHQIINMAVAKDLVISHIYPWKNNEKVLGIDYRTTPSQKAVVLEAIESGRTIIAGPLALVQGGRGIIARSPIINAHTNKVWGVAAIVIDVDQVLKASGVSTQQELAISIRGLDSKGGEGAVFHGDKRLFISPKVTQIIHLPYGEWVLTAEPKAGWATFVLWIKPALFVLLFFVIAFAVLYAWYKNQLLRTGYIEALIDSEKRFRNIFHGHSAAMLLIDAKDGQIMDANRSALQFYGYSLSTLKSKNIKEINQLSEQEVDFYRRQATFGKKHSYIFPHKLSTGEIRQVEVHSSLVKELDKSLLFSVIHDVTERIEYQQQLELYGKVFEHSQEGIIITDADERIVLVNKSFTDMTGYEEQEALGLSPRFLIASKHPNAFFLEIKDSVDQLGYWKGEIWNQRKDGSLFPELLSVCGLKNSNNQLTNYIAVFSDITKIKQSEEQLATLAHYDPLTDLPNRLLLKSRIDHAIMTSKRNGNSIALMFVDLDKFKLVNDTFGHSVGDEVLKEAANRLKGRLREADTIARIGGDEFVVMMEDFEAIDEIELVVGDIIQIMNESFKLPESGEVSIGASVGISLYPDDAETGQQLLVNADAAMYRAKKNGRNAYCFFTENLLQEAKHKLEIANDLRRAIKLSAFELYYQPQISLSTQKVIGAEALIRWNHPDKGFVSPMEFIAIAEERGLIYEITRWVIETACKQIKRWNDRGIYLTISLNVSPRDFSQESFFETLTSHIEASNISPSQIELEITENILMRKSDEIISHLKSLQDFGVSLAVDDFGTGHSSLSYLKHFPMNKLKIDRSFIDDIDVDESDYALAACIVNIAQLFELKTIAEGVETVDQLTKVRQLGCDVVQGYFYSKPLAVDDFEQYVIDRNTD